MYGANAACGISAGSAQVCVTKPEENWIKFLVPYLPEWRDRAGFNGHPDSIPALNLLMQWKSRRQSCLKIDLFPGDGVAEFQKLGVQKISSIAGEAGEIFKRLAG